MNEVKDRQADALREQLGLPAAEMSFLVEAWQQIVECRRVLKWTYAYGYYLESDDEQAQRRRNLFEYLQGQADGALGGLHKCAEKDVDRFFPPKYPGIPHEEAGMQAWHAPSKDEFLKFKSDLTGLTAVTRNFFDNLVKALESGLADVTDQPAAAAGPSKGKGKGKERRKKRQRFGSGKGGEEEEWKDETSGMATIDSGDEDLESGEEGETKEVVGTSSRARGGEEPEYWSCMHCTYANRTGAGSADTCGVCHLPRDNA